MRLNSEFKMYNKVAEFNRYVRNTITNFIPSVHRDIRIHLLDENYSLLHNLLSASYNKGNIRIKYINEMIVNISMIDYLLGEVLELSENNSKKILRAIRMLSEIKNMIYSWKNNIDNGKEEN